MILNILDGCSWKEILNSLYGIKSKYVNKKAILSALEYRRDYDSEILDTLYKLKVIDIDEYIKYMKKVIKITEDIQEYNEKRLKEAINKRENFDPMVYYCCLRQGVNNKFYVSTCNY